jgi:hypothetical protein
LRCGRILDDAAIPFDLNQQQGTDRVLLLLEADVVPQAMISLSRQISKPILYRREFP